MSKALLNALIEGNYLTTIQALAAGNLNLTIKTESGDTLLHLAVQNGFEELILFLLKKGVAVNAQNDDGWTALHLAVSKKGIKFVRSTNILLEKGASLITVTKQNETPYDIAVKNHCDQQKYLLEQKTNIHTDAPTVFLHDEKKPSYIAEIGEGEIIELEEEEIERNGNCGFIGLGTDRRTLTTLLKQHVNEIWIRDLIWLEIAESILTQDFRPIGAEEIIENFETLNEGKLQNFCKSPEIFNAYMDFLADDKRRLFLGYHTALAFARIKNFSLYIWQVSGVEKKLQLRESYSADHNRESDGQEIHLLHTAGFTHFNFLIKKSPKNLSKAVDTNLTENPASSQDICEKSIQRTIESAEKKKQDSNTNVTSLFLKENLAEEKPLSILNLTTKDSLLSITKNETIIEKIVQESDSANVKSNEISLTIHQLLEIYFQPLIKFAKIEVFDKNGLLQLPLWFIRNQELRSKKINEQIKNFKTINKESEHLTDQVFLLNLIGQMLDYEERQDIIEKLSNCLTLPSEQQQEFFRNLPKALQGVNKFVESKEALKKLLESKTISLKKPLLDKLIQIISEKSEFNFDKLTKNEKTILLNLAVSNCKLEASYATSVLITLLLRTDNAGYRRDILQLLISGECNFKKGKSSYLLKLKNKDLTKNFYINFSQIKLSGLKEPICLNLSGQYLRGLKAEKAELKKFSFRYACLQSANLADTNLEKIDFTGSHLGTADFTAASCEGTYFNWCYLNLTLFRDANVKAANFENAIFGLDILTEEQKKLAKFPSAFNEIYNEREEYSRIINLKIQQVISKEHLATPDQGANWPKDPLRWKKTDPWGKECKYEWCKLEENDDLYSVVQGLLRNTSDTMSYTAMFWEPARLLNAYKNGHLLKTMEQDFKQRPNHQGVIESIQIEKIFLIRNPYLWEQFQQRKKEIEEDLLRRKIEHPLAEVQWHGQRNLGQLPLIKPKTGEAWLWHGTSQQWMPSMAAEGYKIRKTGDEPMSLSKILNLFTLDNIAFFIRGYGALGKGAYFSDGFSKSDIYVKTAEGKNTPPLHAIFLMRVLLGRTALDPYQQNKKSEQVPEGFHSLYGPYKGWKENKNSKFDCNEFLVSDKKQIYPEFCIFYRDNSLQLTLEKEQELKKSTYLPSPSEWKTNYPSEKAIFNNLRDYYRLLAMGRLEVQFNFIQKNFQNVNTSASEKLTQALEDEKKFLNAVFGEQKQLPKFSSTLLAHDYTYQIAHYFREDWQFPQAIPYYEKVISRSESAVQAYFEKASAQTQPSLFLQDIHIAFQKDPDYSERYFKDNSYVSIARYYQESLYLLARVESYVDPIDHQAWLHRLLTIAQEKLVLINPESIADELQQLFSIFQQIYKQLLAIEELSSHLVLLWLLLPQELGLIQSKTLTLPPLDYCITITALIDSVKIAEKIVKQETTLPTRVEIYSLVMFALAYGLKIELNLKEKLPQDVFTKASSQSSPFNQEIQMLFTAFAIYILKYYQGALHENQNFKLTVALIDSGIIKPLYTHLHSLLEAKRNLEEVKLSELSRYVWHHYLMARKEWFGINQLFKSLTLDSLFPLPLFRDLPSPDGWSPRFAQEEFEWLEEIHQLLPTEPVSLCSVRGALPGENVEKNIIRYLPPKLVAECFNDKGEFIGNIKTSFENNSIVRKIQWNGKTYFLKIKDGGVETLMGREYAVEYLHRFLGGQCQVAAGRPLQLHYQKGNLNKVHYVWLSQGIDGVVLADVMRENEPNRTRKLNSIDSESYTQLFILAYLTLPEDDQPENFILKVNRLMAIDKGQSFVGSYKKQNPDLLAIKTVVYLLRKFYEKLNTEVLKRIRLIQPTQVIQDWRKVLDELNKLFEPLLIQQKLGKRIIDINEDVLRCVEERLGLLHRVLVNHTHENLIYKKKEEMTGLTLLRLLDPAVLVSYLSYQMIHGTMKTPEDFYNIDPKAYVRNPSTGKTYSSTSWRDIKANTLDVERLQKSMNLTPTYFSTFDWTALRLASGEVDKETQRFYVKLLKAVTKKGQSQFISFTELNLSGCEVITENELLDLIKQMPNLERLTIDYCPQLTVHTIVELLSLKVNRRLGFFERIFEVPYPQLKKITSTNGKCPYEISLPGIETHRKSLILHIEVYQQIFHNLIKWLKIKENIIHIGGCKKWSFISADLQQSIYSHLLTLMKDRSWEIRENTIRIVLQLKDWISLLSPVLQQQLFEQLLVRLNDVNESVRDVAVQSLVQLKDWISLLSPVLQQQLFEQLLVRLNDAHESIRKVAVKSLLLLKDWISLLSPVLQQQLFEQLLARLDDKEWGVLSAVVKVIIKLRDWISLLSPVLQQQLFEQLLTRLNRNESFVYYSAAKIIGQLNNWNLYIRAYQRQQLFEQLLTRLNDKESYVREKATSHLKEFADWLCDLTPNFQQQLFEQLLVRLNDNEANVRTSAIEVLVPVKKRIFHLPSTLQQQLFEQLLARLNEKIEYFRRRALNVLGQLNNWDLYVRPAQKQQLFEQLVVCLNDNKAIVRKAAIQVLVQLRDWISLLSPVLQQQLFEQLLVRLNDAHESIRKVAVKSLLLLKDWISLLSPVLQQQLFKQLLARLNDNGNEWKICEAAAQVIQHLSEKQQLFEQLLACSNNDSPRDQGTNVAILAQLIKYLHFFILLNQLLISFKGAPYIREIALKAFRLHKEELNHLSPALQQQLFEQLFVCLKNNDRWSRQTTIWCLEGLAEWLNHLSSALQQQLFEQLLACLNDVNERVRETVVQCLESLEVWISSLSPVLQQQLFEQLLNLSSDSDIRVCFAAIKALKQFTRLLSLGLHQQLFEQLLIHLKDTNRHTCWKAVFILQQLKNWILHLSINLQQQLFEQLLYVLKNFSSYDDRVQTIKVFTKLFNSNTFIKQIKIWCKSDTSLKLTIASTDTKIAHQIFQYLDEKTLRTSVPLVSRRWLFWQQSYLQARNQKNQQEELKFLQKPT